MQITVNAHHNSQFNNKIKHELIVLDLFTPVNRRKVIRFSRCVFLNTYVNHEMRLKIGIFSRKIKIETRAENSMENAYQTIANNEHIHTEINAL